MDNNAKSAFKFKLGLSMAFANWKVHYYSQCWYKICALLNDLTLSYCCLIKSGTFLFMPMGVPCVFICKFATLALVKQNQLAEIFGRVKKLHQKSININDSLLFNKFLHTKNSLEIIQLHLESIVFNMIFLFCIWLLKKCSIYFSLQLNNTFMFLL